MTTRKGADLIAEFLIKEKMPYIFGICGHGNVGLLDALYDVKDEITLVSPRHEQVAGHMADAYFRVKHEAVATLTSCGPGSACPQAASRDRDRIPTKASRSFKFKTPLNHRMNET